MIATGGRREGDLLNTAANNSMRARDPMSDTTPESQARAATAALIRDYYEAFNSGNTDGMLAFLTDDVIHDVNQGERRQGIEKFRAFNARMTHNYKEDLKDIVVMVSKDATRASAEFNV